MKDSSGNGFTTFSVVLGILVFVGYILMAPGFMSTPFFIIPAMIFSLSSGKKVLDESVGKHTRLRRLAASITGFCGFMFIFIATADYVMGAEKEKFLRDLSLAFNISFTLIMLNFLIGMALLGRIREENGVMSLAKKIADRKMDGLQTHRALRQMERFSTNSAGQATETKVDPADVSLIYHSICILLLAIPKGDGSGMYDVAKSLFHKSGKASFDLTPGMLLDKNTFQWSLILLLLAMRGRDHGVDTLAPNMTTADWNDLALAYLTGVDRKRIDKAGLPDIDGFKREQDVLLFQIISMNKDLYQGVAEKMKHKRSFTRDDFELLSRLIDIPEDFPVPVFSNKDNKNAE